MSRIVNTSSPGSIRNGCRRSIAEMLRRLMMKQQVDQETKDMAAAIVYYLREIDNTIETTTRAWEDRNYFLKADRFRSEWDWTKPSADRLERIVLGNRWSELSRELGALAPHFGDIKIAKLTRSSSTWDGAHARLLAQNAPKE